MQTREEIPPQELVRYAEDVRQLVESVCASAAFKTSPKSCQFLRHVSENTLSGNVDVLKERLIGIHLLGRSTSYDTGADASVRVRANDVRKRLAAHAEAQERGREFSVEIPPGAYIPRFFRPGPGQQAPQPPQGKLASPSTFVHAPSPDTVQTFELPRLSFYWLAGPTLAALFLCTIFMRWRMNEEHLPSAARHDDHPAALSRPSPLSSAPTTASP